MIDAQLGPPPVAASRGGSAPAGGSAGQSATGTLVETDDGGFVAVLDGHAPPDSPDATGTAQNPSAAGPPTGELPTQADADAAGSPPTTAPVDAAALVAALADGAAASAVAAAPATAVAPPVAGTPAVASPAAGMPAAPIPGLVPATLDAQGRIIPAPPQGTPVDPEAATAPAPAGQAPAQTGSGGGGGSSAAATLTLTLKQAGAPVDADGAPAAPAPATQSPAGQGSAKAEVANWHSAARPIGNDVPAPAATAPQPPAGLAFGPAAQAATGPGSLDGLGRPAAGPTTPHELARELGTRLQMAVREGGRELVVTLRPAELGHLTIRVTMQDGVLQAQILADRPEAARMLQQSLGHLGSALGDLGYSLENLDVAYGGDPRDAQASGDADGAVRGEVQEADGTPVATSDDPATAVAGSPARLDLLA